MFRIAEGSSSGSLVQCSAENYKNDSIMSIDMDKVGVMAAYSDLLCMCVVHCTWKLSTTVNYTHAQRVTICCQNTDLVHVNGHDRTILVMEQIQSVTLKTPIFKLLTLIKFRTTFQFFFFHTLVMVIFGASLSSILPLLPTLSLSKPSNSSSSWKWSNSLSSSWNIKYIFISCTKQLNSVGYHQLPVFEQQIWK